MVKFSVYHLALTSVGNYNTDPNTPLNVGLNSYDYGRSWNGAIDEVRLYNRAIPEIEIQNLTDYSIFNHFALPQMIRG